MSYRILDLSGNTISDQTLVSFAQALTSNKRLRKLVIGDWCEHTKLVQRFQNLWLLSVTFYATN